MKVRSVLVTVIITLEKALSITCAVITVKEFQAN